MEIHLCVQEQLLSARIILHEYLFYIEGLPDDGPSKIIMQQLIVNCKDTNTNTEGLIDHTNMLECLRDEVSRLNEMLDREIKQYQRKKGI